MSTEEIKAMQVRFWAARHAVLYLWSTVPKLAEALEVVAAWGFDYKSNIV